MINLLPDTRKAELRSARANTILARYILVLTSALVFIGAVIFVSYNSLKLSEESALSQLSSGSSVAANTPSDAEIRAVTQSTVSASQTLNTIASALPSGVVMKDLSIQPQQLSQLTNISLYAKAGTQGADLAQQLEGTGVFSSVSVTSTQNNNKDRRGYPVKINLSVRITSNQLGDSTRRLMP